MSVTIELAPEIEQQLNRCASSRGLDAPTFVKAMVEEKLRGLVQPADSAQAEDAAVFKDPTVETQSEQTLAQTLAGLIGLVNIGPSDLSERTEEVFGEIVAEKYRKQGLAI